MNDLANGWGKDLVFAERDGNLRLFGALVASDN